jgi:excisionase family DNA binding protein
MKVKARAAVLLPDQAVDAIVDAVVARLGAVQASPWLGVPEAAEHIGCSRHRIYRLVSQRRIPFQHEGRRLVFSRADLDAWIREGGAR